MTIEPAEVPTPKNDLIAHLNRLLKGEIVAKPEPAAKPAKEKKDATKAKTTSKKPTAKKPAAKKPAGRLRRHR